MTFWAPAQPDSGCTSGHSSAPFLDTQESRPPLGLLCVCNVLCFSVSNLSCFACSSKSNTSLQKTLGSCMLSYSGFNLKTAPLVSPRIHRGGSDHGLGEGRSIGLLRSGGPAPPQALLPAWASPEVYALGVVPMMTNLSFAGSQGMFSAQLCILYFAFFYRTAFFS